MRKFLRPYAGALFLMGLSCVISCDDSYDFSNISTEMNIGGSLSAPIGETDTLRLSRIIDLTEELQVDEHGSYVLQSKGNVSVRIAEVEKVYIQRLSPDVVEVPLPVPAQSARQRSLSVDLSVGATMSIEADEAVPSEVVSLSKLTSDPVAVELSFELTLGNPNVFERLSTLEVVDFKLNFPSLFEFAPGIEGMDYANNVLTVSRPFDKNGRLSMPLKVVGLRNLPEVIDGNLHISEKFPLSGTIRLVSDNVSAEELRDLGLNIRVEVPDFDVDRVEGIFAPSIDMSAQRISLGSLPDVLTDPTTHINLNKVGFGVSVENPAGVPFDALLHLSALDESGNPINRQVDVALKVEKAFDYTTSRISRFWVTNIPTFMAPDGYEVVVVPELNRLVGQVPRQVEILPTITVDRSEPHFLQLGKSYVTETDYRVELPFEFGPGSQITYREQVDNLNGDIQDVADMVRELKVTADFTTTVPLDLQLTITPLDIYGKDMSEKLDFTRCLTVAAGSESAPSQVNEFEIREIEDGALKLLDCLQVDVKGNMGSAVSVLKPSQYLMIKMKAHLPKGVTIKE